jgi:nucleoid DNA-binding protein
MGNVYKITAIDIGNILYLDLYKYAVLETDSEEDVLAKQLLMYTDMMSKVREEITEGSVVAIRNFGSFSISKRKSESLYVKFSQAKRLKNNIHSKLKKKMLTNLMLERKQEDNFLELEDMVRLLLVDNKPIYMDDIENIKEKYKSFESKLKKMLVDKILLFFLKVEQLVFEYKLVHINNFGCFYLKNNLLYGLHFKYSSASCKYLFKTKAKINHLIEKLNMIKVEKEMPWE